MNISELIQYLKGKTATMQVVFGSYNYTLVKAAYNADTIIFFIAKVYNGRGAINFLEIGEKLEYQGFYIRKTKMLYDIQYTTQQLLGLDYSERNSIESIKNGLISELTKEVKTKITTDPSLVKDGKINTRDIEYLKQHGAVSDALRLFFEGVTTVDYDPYLSTDNYTNDDIINYINNGKSFINEATTAYIKKNIDKLAYLLIRNEETQKELDKFVADVNGRHYKRRSIANSITDEKTVKVTTKKDNKEFEFTTETDTLKQTGYSYYSELSIKAQDRKKFYEIYGKNADYNENDIIRITHGKRVLYQV